MSLLSSLFGSNKTSKLTEEEIASDMLKDSKFSVLSLATVATQSVNPDLEYAP